MAIKWTDEEVALLREAASSHTVTELAGMFDRSYTAIYQAGYQYGLTFKKAPKGPRRKDATGASTPAAPIVRAASPASGRPWTDADDDELRRIAPELTLPELADRLNRTVKAVRWRVAKLEVVPLDGRTTAQARDRVRQQRLSEPRKEKEADAEPGVTKPCTGVLHAGAERPLTDFPWNRSQLSRGPRCFDCVRAETAQRMTDFRARHRPAGWDSSRSSVECGPDGHVCTMCLLLKPAEAYYADASARCGHSSQCRECKRGARRDRWTENRDGHRDRDVERMAGRSADQLEAWSLRQWTYNLAQRYNLTPADYQSLLDDQGGVCALCGEPESKVHHRSHEVLRLGVDHDHRCCPSATLTCGTCIRGLLCYDCNLIIGKVETKPTMAKQFAEYLARRPFGSREPRLRSVD